MTVVRSAVCFLALIAALFGGVTTMWCCAPKTAQATLSAPCPMEKACCGERGATGSGASCVIGALELPSSMVAAADSTPHAMPVAVIDAGTIDDAQCVALLDTSPRSCYRLFSTATVQLRI